MQELLRATGVDNVKTVFPENRQQAPFPKTFL